MKSYLRLFLISFSFIFVLNVAQAKPFSLVEQGYFLVQFLFPDAEFIPPPEDNIRNMELLFLIQSESRVSVRVAKPPKLVSGEKCRQSFAIKTKPGSSP